MPLDLVLIEALDVNGHQFRVLEPNADGDWLTEVAGEYVRLRTECTLPLQEIILDGVQVLSTDQIRERIRRAAIPRRRQGNFDIVRSDFGEVICYMFLEQVHGTQLGYKSVRDRETVQLTGRGIDAIGVEEDGALTLVLGETKVSDADSPPGVVDQGDDCLRAQQRDHLGDPTATSDKIWNISRGITDPEIRNLYFRAALYLEEQQWDRLNIVACCVLVRPQARYTQRDFGSFRRDPGDYNPAQIRFLIVCVPDDIETVVQNWYTQVERVEALDE